MRTRILFGAAAGTLVATGLASAAVAVPDNSLAPLTVRPAPETKIDGTGVRIVAPTRRPCWRACQMATAHADAAGAPGTFAGSSTTATYSPSATRSPVPATTPLFPPCRTQLGAYC